METSGSFSGCVVPGGIQEEAESNSGVAMPAAKSGDPAIVSSPHGAPRNAWGLKGQDDSTHIDEFLTADSSKENSKECPGGYPSKAEGAGTSSQSHSGSRPGSKTCNAPTSPSGCIGNSHNASKGATCETLVEEFDGHAAGKGAESPTKDLEDVEEGGFFGDGVEAIPFDLPSLSAGVPQSCVNAPEAKAPARVEISDSLGWDSAGAPGHEECGTTASTHVLTSMSDKQWDPTELARTWVGAWNCQGKSVSQKDLEALLPPKAERSNYHLYVLGTFACGRSTQSALISASKEKWERQVLEVLGQDFIVVGSQTLQSMHLVVYAASSYRHLVTNVATGTLKTGFHSELDATVSNFLGKEGSVQICFDIGKTSMVFVYVHLPSKVEERDLRNQHILRIFEESPLKPKHWTAQQFVYLKKRVFVFGDLNYRLDDMTRPEVDKILKDAGDDVTGSAVPELLRHDQLSNLLKRPKDLPSNASMLWSCFAEHEIGFAPTYKFDVAKPDEYDLSSNKKVPGWPVRILWKKSDDVICDGYEAKFGCKVSQHRPVVGHFSVRIDPASAGGSTAWQEKSADNKQSAVCTIS